MPSLNKAPAKAPAKARTLATKAVAFKSRLDDLGIKKKTLTLMLEELQEAIAAREAAERLERERLEREEAERLERERLEEAARLERERLEA
eukprot:CAMPEP_0119286000 /NCGR_PEP_ID=MMETSP1329-20130426/33158_1 /TAXON_ID=114041 /ORGANISM="Genus nov. species nov., Strain RCC1024" /LENGTH=90 /DNA_ID=CAMNT_0007286725 /DNA_START=95 /DNA_END=364 /DNA_ORIENTATION=+